MDILLAGIGLVALAPLFLIIAVAIRLDSPGPVFFRQERVGRKGRIFRIFKFRTMRVDAPATGPALTIGEDPRITRVGRFLRHYKLDELPQLLNVLRGEMSLVGPRPEVPKYVALYDDEQKRVLELTPGITDVASIAFRNESEILGKARDPEREYVERIMPEKIRLNLEYAEKASVFSDIGVLFKTLVAVAFGGWEDRQDR